MGLDITFFKNKNGEGLDNLKECGYLRKHYYVYNYFKGNLVDGEYYCEVSVEDLEALIAKCREVLERRDSWRIADRLLPEGGDYDDLYYDKIKEGLALFKKMLRGFDPDKQTMYVEFWY